MDAKVLKEMLEQQQGQQGHNVAYFRFPYASTGEHECVTNFTPQMVLFGFMNANSRTFSPWFPQEKIQGMMTLWGTDGVTFQNTFGGSDIVLIVFG